MPFLILASGHDFQPNLDPFPATIKLQLIQCSQHFGNSKPIPVGDILCLTLPLI